MKELTDKIKDLRIHIDAQIQSNKSKLNCTSETTRSLRSLELAKGWMGKALYFLGYKTPYNQTSNPDEIPETAEQCDIRKNYQFAFDELPPNQLTYVNNARSVINHLLGRWKEIHDRKSRINIRTFNELNINKPFVDQAFIKTWTHLHEAGMNLGFELQRIRNEHEEEKKQDGAEDINPTRKPDPTRLTSDVSRLPEPSEKLAQQGSRESYHEIFEYLMCKDLVDTDDIALNNPEQLRIGLLLLSLKERIRQIQEEGYTAAHDDFHDDKSLLIAAANYLLHDTPHCVHHCGHQNIATDTDYWPWEKEANKANKHDFTRRAVIVIAWILAEAERRFRSESAEAKTIMD